MPIEVACSCGQRFNADEQYLGRQAKCTGCGKILTIQPATKVGTGTAAAAKPQQLVVACQCGARFAARPELAGKTVACPQCKQPLTIGAATPAQPTAAPVAAQPDPLGDSLWNDLPFSASSLGPATSLPPAKSLASARSSGGRQKLGFDMMGSRPMSEVVAGVVLSIIALFAGIGLGYASLNIDSEHGDSTKWPNTTGTIKSAEVVEAGLGRRGRQNYRAKIEFTYEVNNVPHTSDRFTVGYTPHGNSLTAEMAVSKYPPGSTHPVYYKPEEPSLGVLEPGNGAAGIIFPLAALSLSLIGVIGLIVTTGTLTHRLT